VRFLLGVLTTIGLVTAGLAFTAAVCLATAAIVWAAWSVVSALPPERRERCRG